MAIANPAMPERRQTPRYPVEIGVDFAPADSKVIGVTRDVSLGGVFIQTTTPPPAGQKLLVTFHLADGQELLFFGSVVRTLRPPAIRTGQTPSGFALAISESETYKRLVGSVAATVHGANPQSRDSAGTRDSNDRRLAKSESETTNRPVTDEPQTPFTISLHRLPDGRVLITADDSGDETNPTNIAVRKEAAIRERLTRRHTAKEAAAIMAALSKSGDRATFSQSWPGLDSLRRFWNS